MDLSKSIDFLLENAGPVIRYRLKKEILNDCSKAEEEKLLGEIYETPYFKLVQGYAKPDGYIGSGMHSWDNWRGKVLHETPLQDGETAARLLSNYAIPDEHPLVKNFVAALRDETILREEFSYIPPEIERYNTRFRGINSGFCLMTLVYTMQAMLGYGDDECVRPFQSLCLEAFKSLMPLSKLTDITKTRESRAKYNYPYIEEDTYFPSQYHLETLAYTRAWRTPENITLLTDALNHFNTIAEGKPIHVKIGNRYYAPFPLNMANRPIKPFNVNIIDVITYRRTLTEIAMLGVGDSVDVLRESAENIQEALAKDGILRLNFDVPNNKRYSPKKIEYPTAYTDVRLEADYKNKVALLCDLTFWAVQFMYLYSRRSPFCFA